jgi:hypothetical protein
MTGADALRFLDRLCPHVRAVLTPDDRAAAIPEWKMDQANMRAGFFYSPARTGRR